MFVVLACLEVFRGGYLDEDTSIEVVGEGVNRSVLACCWYVTLRLIELHPPNNLFVFFQDSVCRKTIFSIMNPESNNLLSRIPQVFF